MDDSDGYKVWRLYMPLLDDPVLLLHIKTNRWRCGVTSVRGPELPDSASKLYHPTSSLKRLPRHNRRTILLSSSRTIVLVTSDHLLRVERRLCEEESVQPHPASGFAPADDGLNMSLEIAACSRTNVRNGTVRALQSAPVRRERWNSS